MKKKQRFTRIVGAIFIGFLGYGTSQWLYAKYFQENQPVTIQEQSPSQLATPVDNAAELDACIENVRDTTTRKVPDNASIEEAEFVVNLQQNEIDNCYRRYPL